MYCKLIKGKAIKQHTLGLESLCPRQTYNIWHRWQQNIGSTIKFNGSVKRISRQIIFSIHLQQWKYWWVSPSMYLTSLICTDSWRSSRQVFIIITFVFQRLPATWSHWPSWEWLLCCARFDPRSGMILLHLTRGAN